MADIVKLDTLPDNLPIPLDDGGADHLLGLSLLRIPIQSGRGFRFDPGHHSDLKPAT